MPPKKIKKITANGWMDVLRDPIGTIKESLQSIPTKLNNISTRTMQEFGKSPIMSISIIRTPLSSVWTNAMNTLSMGKFNELQRRMGYDKLFHLSLIVVTEGRKLLVEKNEVINIAPFKMGDVKPETEYMAVPIIAGLTLIQIMDNTLKRMGNDKFYDYDALGNGQTANNCQNFILHILQSNNLLTPQAHRFIYQDMTGIVSELNKSKLTSHVPSTVKKITKIGSFISILTGKGKRNVNKDFIDFVKNDGFRFI
jgi:hypothetical protein